MLRPLDAVDDEPSRLTALPAAIVVADGVMTADGPALTSRLTLEDVDAPTLSVTVSLTTTAPAAVGIRIAVGPLVDPDRLADVAPLSMVHA